MNSAMEKMNSAMEKNQVNCINKESNSNTNVSNNGSRIILSLVESLRLFRSSSCLMVRSQNGVGCLSAAALLILIQGDSKIFTGTL